MPSGKFHNQGLENLSDFEQQTITVQRTLELFKEEMYSHPSFSVLRYMQHFLLNFGVSKDGMSIVLVITIPGYGFNIVYGHETIYAPSWKSAVLSLRRSDELGAQLFLEHSNDLFTHE